MTAADATEHWRAPAYVLAGGRSVRFGSDKARVRLGDELLVERAAREVASVATVVTVVAREAGAYADVGLRTIADRRADAGPLAGIEAALLDANATGADWVLISSCDLIGLREEWLRDLFDARTAQAQAVAFRGDRWMPLPTLMRCEALGVVQTALDQNLFALWRVLETLVTTAVPAPAEWGRAINVNRRDDLARLDSATSGRR